MASVYSAGQVADALLADAEFRALRLGTWLNTPSGEGVAAAAMVLMAAPLKQDIDLLIEGLQLAAQRQQAEARPKLAVGCSGCGPGHHPRLVPQLGRPQDLLAQLRPNSTNARPWRTGGGRRC
jgi:hypothetical protein